MRISREKMLMDMASTVALRGTCLRRQVGAVIALDGRVLSMGYVGAPPGLPHCTPETCSLTTPCTLTIHAEANAVAFAAREGIRLAGAALYCTASPCIHCAKLIISTGVREVYYRDPYRDTDPIKFLKDAGIPCYQYINVTG